MKIFCKTIQLNFSDLSATYIDISEKTGRWSLARIPSSESDVPTEYPSAVLSDYRQLRCKNIAVEEDELPS
jgi:hypothetical protein